MLLITLINNNIAVQCVNLFTHNEQLYLNNLLSNIIIIVFTKDVTFIEISVCIQLQIIISLF